MFSKQSLHVAMLMWGCIFNLIALLCMYMSKNFDKEKRKWLCNADTTGGKTRSYVPGISGTD